MSKELEALEIECGELVEMDLLFLDRNGENQEKWHNSEAFKKAVEFEKKYGKSHTYILKSALQRLESIDNANPSEALEGLERIKFHLLERLRIEDNTEDFIKEYEKIFFEPIKQSLLKAQEQDFNYNKIVIPFFDELVKLLGINDTDEMLDKIKEQEKENVELKSRIQDLEKDLEEQIGCPLEVRERALKQCEFEGLYFETTDTDGFERVGIYKCCLSYDAFTNRFNWNCGWNAETWLNCYKKTWWLKKDKSE